LLAVAFDDRCIEHGRWFRGIVEVFADIVFSQGLF
jgi:hypothetical protein